MNCDVALHLLRYLSLRKRRFDATAAFEDAAALSDGCQVWAIQLHDSLGDSTSFKLRVALPRLHGENFCVR